MSKRCIWGGVSWSHSSAFSFNQIQQLNTQIFLVFAHNGRGKKTKEDISQLLDNKWKIGNSTLDSNIDTIINHTIIWGKSDWATDEES